MKLLTLLIFKLVWLAPLCVVAAPPTPYGGVISHMRSEQPEGMLKQMLEYATDFEDVYLYLVCENSCQRYQLVIAEGLNPGDRYHLFHPLLGSVEENSSFGNFSREVWANTIWPWQQYRHWASQGDRPLSFMRWSLAPFALLGSAVSAPIMPGYALIGRNFRKSKARRHIHFLKDPLSRGEIWELVESNFESNYQGGRFGSQLVSFLVYGHVENMFTAIKSADPRDDRYISLESELIHHEFCGKSSYRYVNRRQRQRRAHYCLRISSLETPSLERRPLMLVPGFFQNAHLFHLDQKSGVSFINYLENNFPVKVYVLNPRATMGGDYPHRSRIDDIAIDDIELGLNFLTQYYNKKPVLIGHSQGAIALQAFTAGLTRCDGRRRWQARRNCFDSELASKRQDQIFSLGLMAGSVSMKTDDKQLKSVAKIGRAIIPTIRDTDVISAATLTEYLAPTNRSNFSRSHFWNFLYNSETLGYVLADEIKDKLYEYTLDHSTLDIILQFAKAVKNQEITARAGASYLTALSNINVPVYQLTFSDDPMARPNLTYQSSFIKIAAKIKEFQQLEGFGHEDIFLQAPLHSYAFEMMEFLLFQ